VSSTAVAESSGPSRWIAGTVEFLKSVRGELGKVTWPTRPELVNATRMIVVLSVLLGLAIGWMDWLLNLILVDGVAALSR
jgi:preprotein translocase subunit SecE